MYTYLQEEAWDQDMDMDRVEGELVQDQEASDLELEEDQRDRELAEPAPVQEALDPEVLTPLRATPTDQGFQRHT